MEERPENSGTVSEWPKLCFVIGPMTRDLDLARQRRLTTEIVKPLLPTGWDVQSPDLPEQRQIMSQVMSKLDRADLVVADITGGNASVMYELGIRHCIGLPTIMVRHKDPKPAGDGESAEPIPFDVRHYRYDALDLDDPAAAREALSTTVDATLAEIDRGLEGTPDNPVTEYYSGWPMIEGAPSAGLALGYYINLMKRTANALYDPTAKVFLLDERKRPTGELDIASIERLNIYVPQDLRWATIDYADVFRQRMKAQNCEINCEVTAAGRRVGTYFVEQDHALIDVPTTLSAIREAVRRRIPGDRGMSSDVARFVVSREIDRFVRALKRYRADELGEKANVTEFLQERIVFFRLFDKPFRLIEYPDDEKRREK